MARVGPKRIRRSVMHIKTNVYIRLITVFAIAGIFISESVERSVSDTHSANVKSRMISARDDVTRVSSGSENRNRTETRNDTDSTFSSEKVARTLNELLQEAIPEQIFGFSNKDSGIVGDGQVVSPVSSLEKTTSDKDRLRGEDMRKRREVHIRVLKGNNHSKALAPTTNEKFEASPNDTNTTKISVGTKWKGPGPFKGILPTEETQHLFRTDNVTHLSFMLYRIIKTHDIKSVLDVPCKQSMLWMRELLQALEFEVPKFHYKCLAPDDISLAEGVVRLQHLSSSTVLKNEHPWASKLPYADLALCWYGLGFLPPSQSWGLLKALRTAGVKFVLVPNYPDVRNNPGSGSASGRINVRRAPYRFDEPLRVMNNISSQTSTSKQLLFYELKSMRRDSL